RKVEAMKIQLINNTSNINIQYKSYVENSGWQTWKKNGEISGTTGKDLKMYGIQIKLQGTNEYSVAYRVHLQDLGWQNWVYDGATAGNIASNKKIEAIEIKIVEKQNQNMTVRYMA